MVSLRPISTTLWCWRLCTNPLSMSSIKDSEVLWFCNLWIKAVISFSFLAHFRLSSILISLVSNVSKSFSNSENVITHPLRIATMWSALSNEVLDVSLNSLPKRKDCRCDNVPLISLTSAMTWRARGGAFLVALVKSIRSVEIWAAAVKMPTTPAAILNGSDIAWEDQNVDWCEGKHWSWGYGILSITLRPYGLKE